MELGLLPRTARSCCFPRFPQALSPASTDRNVCTLARRYPPTVSHRCTNPTPRRVTSTVTRDISSSARRMLAIAKSHPPKSKDRGPKSEEDTQTDFSAMNVLGNTPSPTTAVDACMDDGFALDSGLRVIGSGVLLVGGECFRWRPWVREGTSGVQKMSGTLRNLKSQFDVDRQVWGVLDLVWPKPDLLVLGTGEKTLPLSPKTRKEINDLGIRIEVQDTRNAAAQFNMLATERGTQQIAAALVPVGWREGM